MNRQCCYYIIIYHYYNPYSRTRTNEKSYVVLPETKKRSRVGRPAGGRKGAPEIPEADGLGRCSRCWTALPPPPPLDVCYYDLITHSRAYYILYVCVLHCNLHTYKRRPRAQCTMHLLRRRCSCCIIFIYTYAQWYIT